MSQVRGKIEIHFKLDTDEYPVPSDGNLSLSLREDVQEALEASLAIEINSVKVTRTGIKNDEDRDQDYV